jgi:hypothetical protein
MHQSQDCDGGWLMLIRNIGVISRCRKLRRAPTETVEIIFANVDAVEFDVVFDVCTDRMDMKSTKVPAKLFLLLGTNVFEVLVAEDDYATFSD